MSSEPEETDDTGPQIRPFAAYLQLTNRGRTHDELTEALHTAIAAVEETGKKAQMSLVITIAPTKGAHLSVTEQVTTKLPKPDAHESTFWVDANGNLVDRDPEQMSFGDIRPAPSIPAPRKAQNQ